MQVIIDAFDIRFELYTQLGFRAIRFNFNKSYYKCSCDKTEQGF